MKKISHGCTLDCFDCCKYNSLLVLRGNNDNRKYKVVKKG